MAESILGHCFFAPSFDAAPGGHPFPDKQFNALSGKWENYGNKSERATTCATCHGPAAKRVSTGSAKDIWNPARQPKDIQSRQCGYCHIRIENEKDKTLPGNPSGHFPAPYDYKAEIGLR